jgi:hypothetical protein
MLEKTSMLFATLSSISGRCKKAAKNILRTSFVEVNGWIWAAQIGRDYGSAEW